MQFPIISRFDLQPKAGFYVDFGGFLNSFTSATVNPEITTVKAELLANSYKISQLVKGFDRSDIMLSPGADINVGPIKISTLGSIDIQDFNVEFYADSDLIAEKLYYCWFGHMMDNQTGYKYPRTIYERDIVLYLYDRELLAQASAGKALNNANLPNFAMDGLIHTMYKEKRTYRKCYPTTIQKEQFSTEDSGFVEGINITFTCNGGMELDYNNKNIFGVI